MIHYSEPIMMPLPHWPVTKLLCARDDPKYKDDEEAYEDDLEEMQEKTDALKPKDFPYTFYLMDAAQEKAFDDPIFATYRGPVFWNDCGRWNEN